MRAIAATIVLFLSAGAAVGKDHMAELHQQVQHQTSAHVQSISDAHQQLQTHIDQLNANQQQIDALAGRSRQTAEDASLSPEQKSKIHSDITAEQSKYSNVNEQLLLDIQLASQNMQQAAAAAGAGMSGIKSALSGD